MAASLLALAKYIYYFSSASDTIGSHETGRVNLQSCMNKPRNTLMFTNLASISSQSPISFVGAVFVLFCFTNMLVISLVFWAQLFTEIDESSRARARQVRAQSSLQGLVA